LEWPDLRGKPYVEIIFGKRRIGSKVEEGPRVRGFLLTEDNPSFGAFSDGTIAQSNFFSAGGWPFVVQRIPKSSPDTDVDSKITNRVIELSDAVKDALSNLLPAGTALLKDKVLVDRKILNRDVTLPDIPLCKG